jgi:hypothetical protein
MSDMNVAGEYAQSIERLTKDLREAARSLSAREARFLVDAYYQMQRDRIRSLHQERTQNEGAEPHAVLGWVLGQRETLERRVAGALDIYSGAHRAGVWARGIVGIGPIITAGLLAHIDIARAPTVGHVWRFAGLDPTLKWERGQKRPWNGALKRLCWLIGESFVKVSNREDDVYGKVYRERKDLELARNGVGLFAEQAAASLAAKRWGEDTVARKAYEAGKLPPARLHLRAQRYAVKLFLAHFHHVLHEVELGTPPPKPYVLTHGGHAHYVGPPNWPVQPRSSRVP